MSRLNALTSIILGGVTFLIGCNKTEPSQTLTMKDGLSFKIATTKPILYNKLEDFLADAPQFTAQYTFISCEPEISLMPDSSYTFTGYDDRFLYRWEECEFGQWAKDFGLDPTHSYYCTWIKYVKYVPKSQYDIVPAPPFDNMGQAPHSDRKSFAVEGRIGWPKDILSTYVRYVGYNQSKDGIYTEIPQINQIIWHISVIK